jgi:hypothetical protein
MEREVPGSERKKQNHDLPGNPRGGRSRRAMGRACEFSLRQERGVPSFDKINKPNNLIGRRNSSHAFYSNLVDLTELDQQPTSAVVRKGSSV